MPGARRYASAIAELSGNIYVIGGYVEHREQNTVEYFDPIMNKWTTAAHLIQRVADASAGVANGQIFVMGGFTDHSMPIKKIQRYDPETDSWNMVCIAFSK